MFQFTNSNPNICACILILGICYLTFLRRRVEHFAFIGSLIAAAIRAVMSPLINYVVGLIKRIFGRVAKFAKDAFINLAREIGKTVYTGIMKIVSVIKVTAKDILARINKIIAPYKKPVMIGTAIVTLWGSVLIYLLVLEPLIYPPKLKIPPVAPPSI
jgi:hypothetical protein